ncbi:hypothetical protein TcBrA4_0113000 [Trypanosoma cruzi]|nr:hypothetical protein TcBrA4_0113000 [Trypanosoma cruzi]
MLASRDNILPIFFGWFALKSSTESAFVKAIATKLTEFEPPTGRQAKPCVLKLALNCIPREMKVCCRVNMRKRSVRLNYRGAAQTVGRKISAVGRLFFSESNPMTLVGSRMTTAGGHHNSHT